MSVKINSTSRELTKIERYRLTLSPEIKTVQDLADGTVINVKAFCDFDDIDEDTKIARLQRMIDLFRAAVPFLFVSGDRAPLCP